MGQLGVGKEVLSYCNKCKLTLAHIIVTMKSDTVIGKTTCKTCGGTHAYKDPSAVKANKTKGGTRVKKKSTKDSVSDIWMEKIAGATAKSQKYSPRTTFVKGDIIDHPKFGPGFIDKLIDNDKIQVIFRHEVKTLVHNK
jgi:MinD superfamily P-loop ATPase